MRLDTIRTIIALIAYGKGESLPLTVKYILLHRKLKRECICRKIKGIHIKEKYQLHKTLYRLKEVPRACFSKNEAHFKDE